MAVYNGGRHLAQAVESVLAQDHRDLELLVIDDGSSDGSGAYLDSVRDARVRVIHQANQGLVASLSRGLSEARHEVVARMDADDVSLPTRLTAQLTLLAENPKLSAVGCCFRVVDELGVWLYDEHVPLVPSYLHRLLHAWNPLAHGSMVYRSSDVVAVGGYRADVGPAEDYDLWCRLAQRGPIGAVADVVYTYRSHAASVSGSDLLGQRADAASIRDALLADAGDDALWSSRRVLHDGREQTRLARGRCPRAAARYVFHHLMIARRLAHARRWRHVRGVLMGVGWFLVLHPTAVTVFIPGRMKHLARGLASRRRSTATS
jgi:glycosyltransferase involved in cell wall biosynthesis